MPGKVLANHGIVQRDADGYRLNIDVKSLSPENRNELIRLFFDLFEPERRAINQLIDTIRPDITKKDASVQGFNIGTNCGDTSGQTVAHAHVHLIPCRQGDVQDPRGGVRWVIPGKAVL
jgi:diadenosine tetraphosphate (Ap4A) HIT family hydrolase